MTSNEAFQEDVAQNGRLCGVSRDVDGICLRATLLNNLVCRVDCTTHHPLSRYHFARLSADSLMPIESTVNDKVALADDDIVETSDAEERAELEAARPLYWEALLQPTPSQQGSEARLYAPLSLPGSRETGRLDGGRPRKRYKVRHKTMI